MTRGLRKFFLYFLCRRHICIGSRRGSVSFGRNRICLFRMVSFVTGELIQSYYSVQFILRFDLKCMTNITSIYLKIIYKINSEDFFNTIVVNQIVDKYRTSRFILFFLFFYDEGTYSRY